jgi:hypothetical protein
MVSLTHTPNLTLKQRALTLLTGVLAAGFITPAVADAMGLKLNYVALAGFLIGIAGMSLTAVVVNLADKAKRNPEAALRWLAILTGRTVPPDPPAPPAPPPAPNPPTTAGGADGKGGS